MIELVLPKNSKIQHELDLNFGWFLFDKESEEKKLIFLHDKYPGFSSVIFWDDDDNSRTTFLFKDEEEASLWILNYV